MYPALTMAALDREFRDWPPINRNAYDERFGQYIFNRYRFEIDNSYQVEDATTAYNMIRRELINIMPWEKSTGMMSMQE